MQNRPVFPCGQCSITIPGASYLAGLIPKAADYCPTALTGGMAFVNTDSGIGIEAATCIVTAVTLLVIVIITIPVFNRKQI